MQSLDIMTAQTFIYTIAYVSEYFSGVVKKPTELYR